MSTPDASEAKERLSELPTKIAETLNYLEERYDPQPRIHEYIRPPSRENSLPQLKQVLEQLRALPWESEPNSEEGFQAVEPYKAVHDMTIKDDRKPEGYGRLWIRYGLAGAKDYNDLPENQIMSLDGYINTRGSEPMMLAQESQTPTGSIYVRFTDGNAVHYSLKREASKPDLVTKVTGGPDAIGIQPDIDLTTQITGGKDAF